MLRGKQDDFYRARKKQQVYTLLWSLKRGFKKCVGSYCGLAVLAAIIVATIVGWLAIPHTISAKADDVLLEGLQIASSRFSLIFFSVLLLMLLIYLASEPWLYVRISNKLLSCGFVNSLGLPPVVMGADKLEGKRFKLSLRCDGLSLADYQEKQSAIESALGMDIIRLSAGTNTNTVIMWVAPPTNLSAMVVWDNGNISGNDAIIPLGVSKCGVTTVDISKRPMMLIAGATGSGKSFLLRGIMLTHLLHGNTVHLIDLKQTGYKSIWRSYLHLVTDFDELKGCFETVIRELNRRRQLYLDEDVNDISEYREKTKTYLPRVIVVFDEYAELENTAIRLNRMKEAKEIESDIRTIAAMGRSYGIHLVLCTQRADAKIDGSIRSNCDVRILGRCDANLSIVVVGDSRGDELIDKYTPGRFLLATGDGLDEVFQAFFVDDDLLATYMKDAADSEPILNFED